MVHTIKLVVKSLTKGNSCGTILAIIKVKEGYHETEIRIYSKIKSDTAIIYVYEKITRCVEDESE